MKLFRKACLFVLVFITVITLITNKTFALDVTSNPLELNQISNSSLMEKLLSQGVVFPDEWSVEYSEAVAQEVVSEFEKDPLFNPTYNYSSLQNVAMQIAALYKGDHSLFSLEKSQDSITALAYTLVNSTVIGSWNPAYTAYNCYGYAINQTSKYVNPGHYSGKTFLIDFTISKMAEYVRDDLSVLGYYSTVSATKPNLASWDSLICIRKGSIDYHLMKYVGTKWQHKPGNTNPLTWKYASASAATWTNEHSYQNISYAGSTTYTSNVIYIKYWSKTGPGPQPQSVDGVEVRSE